MGHFWIWCEIIFIVYTVLNLHANIGFVHCEAAVTSGRTSSLNRHTPFQRCVCILRCMCFVRVVCVCVCVCVYVCYAVCETCIPICTIQSKLFYSLCIRWIVEYDEPIFTIQLEGMPICQVLHTLPTPLFFSYPLIVLVSRALKAVIRIQE